VVSLQASCTSIPTADAFDGRLPDSAVASVVVQSMWLLVYRLAFLFKRTKGDGERHRDGWERADGDDIGMLETEKMFARDQPDRGWLAPPV